MHPRFSPCLLLLAFTLMGCGDGAPKDAPKLAPAAGIVSYNGRPVADASITFFPEKGPVGNATSDKEGKFQIKTNGALGASVGKHKVTITNAMKPEELPEANGKEVEFAKKVKGVVPAKYNSKETTDLNIDIPAEGNDKLTLNPT